MLVFPAIDLLDGTAVRLEQGRRESVEGVLPRAVGGGGAVRRRRRPAPARRRSGRRLHARRGRAQGQPRDDRAHRRGDERRGRGRAAACARSTTARRCSTRACATRCWARRRSRTRRWSRRRARAGPARIVVAVDAREGKVVGRGLDRDDRRSTPSRWARRSRARARRPCSTPTSRATACARGPNLDATARLARRLLPCPVIASGGVSRLEDLDALAPTRRLRGRGRQGAVREGVHRRRGGRARARASA